MLLLIYSIRQKPTYIAQFISNIIFLSYSVSRHFLINNSTRFANLLSCCSFVAGEHPYFDVRAHEILDAALNIVLQKIFDACNTQKGIA